LPVAATMSIRLTIRDEMAQVAREHGTNLIPVGDDILLVESGLDSLSIAVLIARLENHLGIDPFRTSEDGQLPATIGDFVRVYEALLSGGDGSRDKPNKG
jgi:acyl carrier protein